MPMTPERWDWLSRYASELYADEDEQMATLDRRASQAGLPSWAVTPDVGRLLQILVSLTPGRIVIELGTLGGYSAIWIARGLPEGGKLITIEYDPAHARFAAGEIEAAGLADRVEIVEGAALEVLPALLDRLGPGSVDFVFVDAVKEEYTAYFEALRPMIAVGGLVVADNVYGTGQGWIDEGYGTDEFNRHVAADPDFLSVITPMRQGLLIARRER